MTLSNRVLCSVRVDCGIVEVFCCPLQILQSSLQMAFRILGLFLSPGLGHDKLRRWMKCIKSFDLHRRDREANASTKTAWCHYHVRRLQSALRILRIPRNRVLHPLLSPSPSFSLSISTNPSSLGCRSPTSTYYFTELLATRRQLTTLIHTYPTSICRHHVSRGRPYRLLRRGAADHRARHHCGPRRYQR